MRINLEFHRQMIGISQSDLARRSGIAQAAVSMIEAGKREPTIGTAVKLAKGLDITLDELAGLSPPKNTGELRAEVARLKKALEQIHGLSA